MTEAEWLAATEPRPMLDFLQEKIGERERRLYECACCRRVWHEFVDDRSRQAVSVAEEYADGLVTDDNLEIVANEASKAWPHDQRQFAPDGHLMIPAAAYNVAIPMGWWGGAPAFMPPSSIILEAALDPIAELKAQAAFLRDIFNPFHPIILEPLWQTSTVRAIAKQMYDSRDFSPMPILADALQDAGYEQEDILNHCRGEGPHVRGC